MTPLITAEKAAERTGLTLNELAALRWTRRHGEPDAIAYTFMHRGEQAKPLYDEASVTAWVATHGRRQEVTA